jgi:CRISPR system Cascade subunit CasE
MIHLSRLILDPLSRQVQAELSNPYEMHRTLCHAFPDLSKEEWEAARVLFRADEDGGRLALLVQSKVAPDWAAFGSHLKGRYLVGPVQTKVWQPEFHVEQQLRFRLQANPVFAHKAAGAKNGARRGLFREVERLDWLRRQGQNHGFEMTPVETILRFDPHKEVVFRGRAIEQDEVLPLPLCEVVDLNDGRRFALPGHKCQFSAARFEGVLRVSDADAFTHAVENGIGKARGFGFGLLSVAPASK